MSFVKLYFAYIRCFIKARSEYRVSFFMGMLANFYSYFINFLLFYVIIQNFGSIRGWEFYDLCILYGLNLLTYAIAAMLFWTVFGVEHDNLGGNLDVLLIRPLSLIKSLICRKMVDTFWGQIIVTVGFIGVALVKENIISDIEKLLFFFLSILGGVMIHAATMVFFGALSFWTQRSLFLADLIYYDFRIFLEYPLTIFPVWIKYVFTFVLPWAFINYYPSLVLLNKGVSTFDYIMGGISPVVGAILFGLSIQFFYFGLKQYEGTGS